jgi:hypothetical protein
MSDRFDLYGAIYLLCVRWHSGQWSRGDRLLGRLHTAGYRPGLKIRNGRSFESDEQRRIYKQLLRHRRTL